MENGTLSGATPIGILPVCSGRMSDRLQRGARIFGGALLLGSVSLLVAACSPATSPTNTHTSAPPTHEATEKWPVSSPETHSDQHDVDHIDDRVVQLDSTELDALGIELATAGPGTVELVRRFPGEVRLNQEQFAHVVARVPGVVTSVAVSVGDRVEAGQLMARLESRELAALTAAYLGAIEHRKLTETHFKRIADLRARALSAESAYFEAQQAVAEARISAEAAYHALQALGFTETWIEALPKAPDNARFRYPLKAPLDGVVIKRHLVRGEAVNANTEVFQVADLSMVWVDLSIYQDALGLVREGQTVRILANGQQEEATLSYVRPIVGEDTRAGLARVVLENPKRRWTPGMFVSGEIVLDEIEAPVVVESTALQSVDDRTVVFVKTPEGFHARPVVVGAQGPQSVVIKQGLEPGGTYVRSGSFTLKAELAKGGFEAGHSH